MKMPNPLHLTPADHGWLRPYRGDRAGEYQAGFDQAAHAAWWQIQGARTVTFHDTSGGELHRVELPDDAPTTPTFRPGNDWPIAGRAVLAIVRDHTGGELHRTAPLTLRQGDTYTVEWAHIGGDS